MPPAALGTAFNRVTRRTDVADGRGSLRSAGDQGRAARALPVQARRLAGRTLGRRHGGKGGPEDLRLSRFGRRRRDPREVGVKCAATRDAADEWLKLYPDDAAVMAYIGRSGWNTLRFGGAIPDDEVLDAVEESYRMIVAKLPKKDRPA
jgi:hypothetical protein